MPLSQPPLSMTKVAFGAQSLDDMRGWFADGGRRGHDPADAPGITRLTPRYLPKRHAEMIGGSVYWILKHQLVARSEITGFAEAEGGRCAILISTRLVEVHPRARRAHQGWRYLEHDAVPPDLASGEAGEILPGDMAHELAKLGLL
jgi:hypothetical protein